MENCFIWGLTAEELWEGCFQLPSPQPVGFSLPGDKISAIFIPKRL